MRYSVESIDSFVGCIKESSIHNQTVYNKFKNNNFMENRRDGIRLFCEASSIRGMSKIIKSQNAFLRCLWMAFVFFMSFFLFVSTTLLVRDYLTYDVNVQTTLLMNTDSEFPAITICHHHPFSERAYDLWRNGNVMSPRQFNTELRNFTMKYIQSDNLEDNEAAQYGYHLDTIDVYYQSFNSSIVEEMGHNASILRGCMVKKKVEHNFQDDCNSLDGFRVRTSSYTRYLNCHTVEPVSDNAKNNTLSLGIIVDLGPKPDLDNFEQSFITDIFDQAEGLRVVIHEPGRFADVMHDGVHVEPGKLNEITYEPVRWDKHSSPIRPCVSDEKDLPKLKDMNLYYNYTYEACISDQEAHDYITKCNCVYALRLRRQPPTKDFPYCGNIFYDKENATKIKTLVDCFAKVQHIHNEIVGQMTYNQCWPRCNYHIYEKGVSVTKWRTQDWQLRWMRKMVSGIDKVNQIIENESLSNKEKSALIAEQRPKFLEYVNRSDLKLNDSGNDLLQGGNFAYVVLKRKNTHVVLKSEKLVLSLNVLLSRIGGLCSLTIGLTMAFVVEIIEFLYMYHVMPLPTEDKSHKNSTSRSKLKKIDNTSNANAVEHHQLHVINATMQSDSCSDVDDVKNGLVSSQLLLKNKSVTSRSMHVPSSKSYS